MVSVHEKKPEVENLVRLSLWGSRDSHRGLAEEILEIIVGKTTGCFQRMTRKNLSSGKPDQWSETRWWLLLSNVSFSFALRWLFIRTTWCLSVLNPRIFFGGLPYILAPEILASALLKKADAISAIEAWALRHNTWRLITPYFVLRAAAFTIYTTVERTFEVFPKSFLLQCGEIVSCCVCQGAIGSVWFFQLHTYIGLCTIYVLGDRLCR